MRRFIDAHAAGRGEPASATAMILLVPLLTMPQVTHYVLDAFIWRVNKKGKGEVRSVIG